MEVIKLFGLDDATHEFQTLEVLTGTHAHCVEVELSHSLNDGLAWGLSIFFSRLFSCEYVFLSDDGSITYGGIRKDNLIKELADCPLELAMALSYRVSMFPERLRDSMAYLVEVGTIVSFRQPGRLSVGHFAQFADDSAMNNRLFSPNETNLQPRVLWLCDDLMSVKSIEGFSGILTSWCVGISY